MVAVTKLQPHHWRLLIFLSVATFFEGYDFLALSQILPQLQADMGLSPPQVGMLLGVINSGTVAAFLLVRQADRWGRKRVLTITIAGYTVFTFLSGIAPNAWVFAPLQFFARMFLIAEWAISMVYVAEEFPADRRATIMGIVQGFSSLGSIVCAGVVPFLLKTDYGWRTVYFVGIVPLILLAFARRNLKETERFKVIASAGPSKRESLFRIWRTPYRTRVLKLAAIWSLTYLCTQNAVTFWKAFAVQERGFTDGEVGLSISIAAVVAMPLVFAAGKLLDVVGRHRGAAIIFAVSAASTVGAFTFEDRWLLTISLMGAIFGASGVLPVLNGYTNELFPTDLRGDAFAWANNLLGRIGYVGGPLLVGVLAGMWGGYGAAVAVTAVFPIIAVVLIIRWCPETKGCELEESARL